MGNEDSDVDFENFAFDICEVPQFSIVMFESPPREPEFTSIVEHNSSSKLTDRLLTLYLKTG